MPKNKKLTWNLSPLAKSDTDPKLGKARTLAGEKARLFVAKWRERTDYLRDPKVLKLALDEYEHWAANYGLSGPAGYYYGLRLTQDLSNKKLKALENKNREHASKLINEILFFEHRLARIPVNQQKRFLSQPALAPYHNFLSNLFISAKHLLTEPEEKILTLKSGVSHSKWVNLTQEFISKETATVFTGKKKEEKNFSEIISLMDSAEKRVRDSAAAAFNLVMAKHSDTAEAELNAVLENKKIDDELRSFVRPDQARHLSDNIDAATVDAMIDAVSSRFDISRRFYELKARLHRLPKLEYHERNIPYGRLNNHHSFPKAVKVVRETLADLDQELAEIFDQFISAGQLDVFPNKGKVSGAFCADDLITLPTYILLNFTGKLRDVTTLAHEVGHGINNELMKKKQNALNFGTPLATAEVASTFFENFVTKRLAGELDDERRLAFLMQDLGDTVSSISRQVACYRFEQELHNNFRQAGYLSKQEIGKLFQEHMKSYLGRAVKLSLGSENWWVYWSHIRSFFYVYSYASGLLISKSLQAKVQADKKFINQVKKFLSAGTSDTPKNIFAKMDINIADKKFWLTGLAEIDSQLKEATALAKKLKKI
jgi:oligoendopeptidase F